MRIVFTRFPLESAYGGAEIQTLSLMKGLRERGHDASFIGSCEPLLELARQEELFVRPLDIGPPPVTKTGAIDFLWRRKEMKPAIENALAAGNAKGEPFDAVCMLSLSEKLLATEWAASHGKKVLWIEHDRVGRWLRWNPWLRALRAQSVHATTVAVSELSRKMYLELGWDPKRTVAIPNGIDVARLGKPSRRGHDHDGMLRIGCVARLSPEKGVDLLIDAVKDLPNVTLDIVGHGPEEKRIQERIRDLGSAEAHETEFGHLADAARARLFPRVKNLAEFHATHDVIVLPSRDNDPFGLSAGEAMLMGAPVIVTDACGIASYLTDGKDALVVSAGSAEALRRGIERLRQDPSLREKMGEAGKHTAKSAFAVEKMVDAYERLFRESGIGE